jgi:formylglycine-generating enzyme required for sulfatase activity
MWRENWRIWRSWPDSQIPKMLEAGQVTQEDAEEWTMIRAMDAAAFESWLESWLVSHGVPGGRYTRPHFFEDSAFNAPLQPVVGVCWHEARAYCAWLSAQTDRTYRLPTEHEWEAAARGQARRPYAYDGEFDPAKGNTYETRLKRTTPAGVFPEGDTPEGISDLAANSIDWTSGPWVSDAVPEVSAGARNDASLVRRVVCGASWETVRIHAYAALRGPGELEWRNPSIGFRVVCVPPIK